MRLIVRRGFRTDEGTVVNAGVGLGVGGGVWLSDGSMVRSGVRPSNNAEGWQTTGASVGPALSMSEFLSKY